MRQHRAEFERLHRGKYVLIDIRTEKLFLDGSPEGAYRQAAAEHEEGPFHLVRVGDRAAFRSRRLPNGTDTRVTR
jgi:rhodanese-related sulfurtransferase